MTTIYDIDELQKRISELRGIVFTHYCRECWPDHQHGIYCSNCGRPSGVSGSATYVALRSENVRLRSALDLLLNAIWIHVNAPDDNGEQLQDAYRMVSSASTMTGASEK